MFLFGGSLLAPFYIKLLSFRISFVFDHKLIDQTAQVGVILLYEFLQVFSVLVFHQYDLESKQLCEDSLSVWMSAFFEDLSEGETSLIECV